MPIIWIASECQGKEKLDYLLQAIESALSLSTTTLVVLSIHTDNRLPLMNSRVVVKERQKSMS